MFNFYSLKHVPFKQVRLKTAFRKVKEINSLRLVPIKDSLNSRKIVTKDRIR